MKFFANDLDRRIYNKNIMIVYVFFNFTMFSRINSQIIILIKKFSKHLISIICQKDICLNIIISEIRKMIFFELFQYMFKRSQISTIFFR